MHIFLYFRYCYIQNEQFFEIKRFEKNTISKLPFIVTIGFSCNQELDKNRLSVNTEFSLKENIERYDQKNNTYNQIINIASPDTELGCIPSDCNGVEGYYSHAFFDFEFDLSSCISPEPLSDCMVRVGKEVLLGLLPMFAKVVEFWTSPF